MRSKDLRAIRPWIVPVNAQGRHARRSVADNPGTIGARSVPEWLSQLQKYPDEDVRGNCRKKAMKKNHLKT